MWRLILVAVVAVVAFILIRDSWKQRGPRNKREPWEQDPDAWRKGKRGS